jgi:hypothetical protein
MTSSVTTWGRWWLFGAEGSVLSDVIRDSALIIIGLMICCFGIVLALWNFISGRMMIFNLWPFFFAILIGATIIIIAKYSKSQPEAIVSVLNQLEQEFDNEYVSRSDSITDLKPKVEFFSEAIRFYFGSYEQAASSLGPPDKSADNMDILVEMSDHIVKTLHQQSSPPDERIKIIRDKTKLILEQLKTLQLGVVGTSRREEIQQLNRASIPPGFQRILADTQSLANAKKLLANINSKKNEEYVERIYTQSNTLFLSSLIILAFAPTAWNASMSKKISDTLNLVIVRLNASERQSSRALLVEQHKTVLEATTMNLRSIRPRPDVPLFFSEK